jgi:hypothetical protein
MKAVSIQEIKQKAQRLNKSNKKWHFHILTPNCQLNQKKKYAFILENTTDNKVFVCYSEKPYMNLGKKLLKLLHGIDAVQKGNKEKSPVSSTVKTILKRAKELNQQGKFWHHHLLLPDCIFNQHQGEWVIMFEDQENKQTLTSITDHEPKEDLVQIETLYYQQKALT